MKLPVQQRLLAGFLCIFLLFNNGGDSVTGQSNLQWLIPLIPHYWYPDQVGKAYNLALDFRTEPASLGSRITASHSNYNLDRPLLLVNQSGEILAYSVSTDSISIHHFFSDKSFNLPLPLDTTLFKGTPDEGQIPFRYAFSAVLPTDQQHVYRVVLTAILSNAAYTHYALQRVYELEFFSSPDSLYLLGFNYLKQLSWYGESRWKKKWIPHGSRKPTCIFTAHGSDPESYWMVYSHRDSTGVVKYNIRSGFEKNVQFFSTLNNFIITNSHFSGNPISFNSKGNKIIAAGFNMDTSLLNEPSRNKPIDPNNSLYMYDFNNLTGEISNAVVVHQSRVVANGNTWFDPEFSYAIFSSNDSIVYAMVDPLYHWPNAIFQYKLFDTTQTGPLFIPWTGNKHQMFIGDAKLGPDGQIYITSAFSHGSPDDLAVIRYPNRRGTACGLLVFSEDSLRNLAGPYYPTGTIPVFQNWPSFVEPYHRLGFEPGRSCSGKSTRVLNDCDSNFFNRYRFYFGDGDSAEMNNNTRLADGSWAVEHTYALPGRYAVRLQAFRKKGSWLWYTDTITVLQSPKALFANRDSTGCQWIAYRFVNQSQASFKKQPITWFWDFGDGHDTVFVQTPPKAKPNPLHTYTQSGLFRVTLRIDDGYCRDTFYLDNRVNILPAPQPGITLNATYGCTPFEVHFARTWQDATDSVHWQSGDGQDYRTEQGLHTYRKPGSFEITQTLFGPTGCVTRDTQRVEVIEGFEEDYLPYLLRATLEGTDKVLVEWQEHPRAGAYNMYRNGDLVNKISATEYLETYDHPKAQYHIRALNLCEQESAQSNPGQLILLQGEQTGNEVAWVRWSGYVQWKQGVSRYVVQMNTSVPGEDDAAFVDLAVLDSGTFHLEDPQYRSDGAWQKCYRIKAISIENPNLVSYSNVLCLPYAPVFFIPDAFSPNADAHNNSFGPFSLGVTDYTLRIYNRWGGEIYSGRRWDGTYRDLPVPAGRYLYTIEGKTAKGGNIHLKGNVQLIR